MFECRRCGVRFNKFDSVYRINPSIAYHRRCLCCTICYRHLQCGDAFVQYDKSICCISHMTQSSPDNEDSSIATDYLMGSIGIEDPDSVKKRKQNKTSKIDSKLSHVWLHCHNSTPIITNDETTTSTPTAPSRLNETVSPNITRSSVYIPNNLADIHNQTGSPTTKEKGHINRTQSSEAIVQTREVSLSISSPKLKEEHSMNCISDLPAKINGGSVVPEKILMSEQTNGLSRDSCAKAEMFDGTDIEKHVLNAPLCSKMVTNEADEMTSGSPQIPSPSEELCDLGVDSECKFSTRSTVGHRKNSSEVEKNKRVRTSFKHQQLKFMKAFFEVSQNPDSKDLKQLSQTTGLSKRVLQVWFQNARAKYRRAISSNSQNHCTNTSQSTISNVTTPNLHTLAPAIFPINSLNNNPLSFNCLSTSSSPLASYPPTDSRPVMSSWGHMGSEEPNRSNPEFPDTDGLVSNPSVPQSTSFMNIGLWNEPAQNEVLSLERNNTNPLSFKLTEVTHWNSAVTSTGSSNHRHSASLSFETASTNSPTSQMHSLDEGGSDTYNASFVLFSETDVEINNPQTLLPIYNH